MRTADNASARIIVPRINASHISRVIKSKFMCAPIKTPRPITDEARRCDAVQPLAAGACGVAYGLPELEDDTGSAMLKVVPIPSALSNQMRPFIASTSCLHK